MNVTVIVICLIIIVILFEIFDRVKNKRKYELLKQFPSYPKYPLIGNALMIFGPMNDVLTRFDKLLEPYDRLVFWLCSVPVLFLKKHEDIVTILSQSHHRDMLGLATEWIGTGILNEEYEEWKKSRRILAPAFSSEMLSKYMDTFNEQSLALVNTFKKVADTGEVINVCDYLTKANIHTIIENSIGVSIQSTGEKGEKSAEAVYAAFHNIAIRIITPWLHPSFIYNVYLKITGKSDIVKQLHSLPTEILKDKVAKYRNEKQQFDHVDSSKTIMDQLIKGGLQEPSFTETRMRDELLQIIAAAVETSSMNACFLMLMLAIHQDVQQKVYEEITQLLENHEKVTPDHAFNHMKYLEQCIMETTRVYTQSVATLRRTHKECVLKDGKIVPENTLVFLALHWVHYDKDLYKNPFKWDPENFNEQVEQSRPKNSLLSFGYGPRSCLGQKYAMMTIKTQIAHILRNYHLSTNMKEFAYDNLTGDVAIRSKIGYPIKFTSRQKLM
ncbi:cytochrome P450 4C1-like [Planococcus citri]|uniref:cytochrome P450 4C1-like n=1 Tax=Planococcus citri TaxID=170843 RepID=UPI0031FA35F8